MCVRACMRACVRVCACACTQPTKCIHMWNNRLHCVHSRDLDNVSCQLLVFMSSKHTHSFTHQALEYKLVGNHILSHFGGHPHD